jgi:phage gp46-like protein
MKTNPILRNLLIASIICINIFAIVQGIAYKSYWGITLAIASLGALLLSLKLLKKLQEVEEEFE